MSRTGFSDPFPRLGPDFSGVAVGEKRVKMPEIHLRRTYYTSFVSLMFSQHHFDTWGRIFRKSAWALMCEAVQVPTFVI